MLLSTSCAKVQLKDSTWLGSLGRDGAAEFHTLTMEKRHVPLTEFNRMWEDLSHPMVCTYVETFADWKSIIEKLCSYAPGKCTYEDKQKIAKFFHQMTRYWAYAPEPVYLRDFPSDPAAN